MFSATGLAQFPDSGANPPTAPAHATLACRECLTRLYRHYAHEWHARDETMFALGPFRLVPHVAVCPRGGSRPGEIRHVVCDVPKKTRSAVTFFDGKPF
jgi:hypothetical protein